MYDCPRHLAAIAEADVVRYSRLMEADGAGTLAALIERRKVIGERVVKVHGGRIVKVMGEGVTASGHAFWSGDVRNSSDIGPKSTVWPCPHKFGLPPDSGRRGRSRRAVDD